MCPRCTGFRRTRNVCLAVIIPLAALAAIFLIYPSIGESIASISRSQPNPLFGTLPSGEQDAIQRSESIDPNIAGSKVTLNEPVGAPVVQYAYTIDELQKYALQKINDDRRDFGAPTVELGSNQAAQVHAEDILKTRLISHWMTNGEKPYMTYSRLGGTGSVAQNVYVYGYFDANYFECSSGRALCTAVDPKEGIDSGQYAMMYDDLECCDNGHRDNIIDPAHTHVSLGMAYDDYYFVLVQNFENNYVDFIAPIDSGDTRDIRLTGYLPPSMGLYGVNIGYDPLPTADTYETNKMRTSYDQGTIVAGVAPPGSYYEGIETVAASNWFEGNGLIDIRFDLSELGKGRPGVYTINVWLSDEMGNLVQASNHAVQIVP